MNRDQILQDKVIMALGAARFERIIMEIEMEEMRREIETLKASAGKSGDDTPA